MKNIILIIFWSCFFLLSSNSFVAQNSSQDSIRATFYNEKVNYYETKNFDTAIIYIDSFIESASMLNWYDRQIEALLKKAELALYSGKIDLLYATIENSEKFIIEYKEELKKNSRYFEFKRLSLLSMFYHISGQIDQAESITKRLVHSLESVTERNKALTSLLIESYFNLATFLRNKGSYTRALDYAHKALDLQSPAERTMNYMYVANIYLILGEKQRTIEYAEKAILNLKTKFKKTKSKKRNDRLIDAYYTLVEAYLIDKDYQLALLSLEESLNYHISDDPLLPLTFERFGRIHAAMKNYNEAITFYEKSISLRMKLQGVDAHPQFAKSYKYMGELYFKQKEYLSALDFFQTAIINLVNGFDNKNYESNPDIVKLYFKKELLELIGKKAQCFYQLSLKEDTNEKFISLVRNNVKLAVDLIDSIRLDYTEDADKQFLLAQSYAIYEIGIDLAIRQGKHERAFMLSEKSRAMVLSEGIHRKKARMLADIGEAERTKIQQIEQAISNFKQKLENAATDKKMAQFRDTIFQLKREHETRMAQIKTSSTFKQSLAENRVFSLAEIKERLRSSGQAIVEFFEGEDFIYAFYLEPTKETIKSVKIPRTLALNEALVNISENLNQQNDTLYCEQAMLIYQSLFTPIWGNTLPERLIIIPDGILGNIPYNVLLTETVDVKPLQAFRQVPPYLIRQTSLSIAFSATTLLNQDFRMESKEAQAKLIAYAPSFRESELLSAQREVASMERNNLGNLIFNKKEVEAISKFGGRKVMGEEASKKHFLEHVAKYRNAHIAAHAQVDWTNSDMSFIAFSDLVDTADFDYKLTIDELYSLNLPMDMVVLSACETGVGKAVKGEGIISIARAFAYAGVQSIVTTLWKVNDLSTSRLVEHFYHRLNQQKPKDIALQKATQDYLNNKVVDLNSKHPKYWAAFTVIGNTEAIDLGDSSTTLWIAFIGIALMFLAGFFWKSKQA